jgi:TRAP transporter TAXI family solute receptor
VALAVAAAPATAFAQALSIVTTAAGSFTHSTGAAIAKVMVQHGGMRATVSPQQSHGQESVNDGSADLSLATLSDVQQYVTGTVDWAGKGQKKNIRLISRVVPIRTAGLVKLDSPIKTLKDVKGKRAPTEYPAQKSVFRVVQAQLASVGLSVADVVPVRTRNIIASADDFAAGKTDIFWFALGSAKVKQVAAGVGGLRALSVGTSAEAKVAMRKFVPGSYPILLKPSKQLEEVREPTWGMAYDVVFFTRADLSDDVVYKITKTMHANKKDMASVFGALNGFDPDRMATEYDDLTYHPGAVKFFKEAGLWPPKKID